MWSAFNWLWIRNTSADDWAGKENRYKLPGPDGPERGPGPDFVEFSATESHVFPIECKDFQPASPC